MVNTEYFIKRLEVILDYYGLNASAFADKIGVQRSSLSHLLSGRNKPSLDFILKIIDVFPDVDLYWILNGKGTFPKSTEPVQKREVIVDDIILPSPSTTIQELAPAANLFSEEPNNSDENRDGIKTEEIKNAVTESISSEVEKIVFFYKNGTFKVFTPN
jgi:transcriptional regulator with XRE-family HTH domain